MITRTTPLRITGGSWIHAHASPAIGPHGPLNASPKTDSPPSPLHHTPTPAHHFVAAHPATGCTLPGRYVAASTEDVRAACEAAAECWNSPPGIQDRAALLREVAARVELHAPHILALAARETGYTRFRLRPELARVVGTLRMMAGTIEEGSWSRPVIDPPAAPGQAIGPNHDLRRFLVPLGPVAVFGASNFPLAYGVLGGDTASALAAGCPVIVKSHPLHPGTGECLAQLCVGALRDVLGGACPGFFSFLQSGGPRNIDLGKELVTHPAIAAVGFTGSRGGGLALAALAAARPTPIPVFAEMGSANIALIASHAGAARAEQIADQLATAILSSSGQQCTKPGQLIVPAGEVFERVLGVLKRRFERWKPRPLLGATVAKGYDWRLKEVEAAGEGKLSLWRPPFPASLSRRHELMPRPAIVTRHDLGAVTPAASSDGATVTPNRAGVEEIFGPGVMIAAVPDPLVDVVALLAGPSPALEPCLAISLYADEADLARAEASAAILALTRHTGRLVFNGVTTGVRVAEAMVHGGPYPCTNKPESTAVGPMALERWCRPVCFQNAPASVLPAELRK